MVVNCEHVWREVSNYLDGEVDPETRIAMELHFAQCKHCTAVLDGARNVVQLYGDDRVFELPAGFSDACSAAWPTHHLLRTSQAGNLSGCWL